MTIKDIAKKCKVGVSTVSRAMNNHPDINPETKEMIMRVIEAVSYTHLDMREFELYGTVRAVISICDSMNYILEEEDLLQVFRLVNNYLDPGGYFIFDLNTIYKYEQIGESTIAENLEEASFIWDNFYDAKTQINEYELAIFIPEGEEGLYRKYEEFHEQRGYDPEVIRRLLEEAGMRFVAAYDAFTRNPVRPDSERIYVIARESGKQYIYHLIL